MQRDTILEYGALTVAIPTYNRSESLVNMLESVVRSRIDLQYVWVVDNASTDNTEEVCARFSSMGIRYTRHDHNVGGIGNYNFILANCKTDYLLVMHDDDAVDEDYIRSQFAIVSGSEYGIVSSAAKRVSQDGSAEHMYFQGMRGGFRIDIGCFASQIAGAKNPIICPTVIFNFRVLDRSTTRFRTDIGPASDYYLWYELNQVAPIYVSSNNGYRYTVHSEQDSHRYFVPMQTQVFTEFSKVIRFSFFGRMAWFMKSALYLVANLVNRNYSFATVFGLIPHLGGFFRPSKWGKGL